jgi:hypothetical protein
METVSTSVLDIYPNNNKHMFHLIFILKEPSEFRIRNHLPKTGTGLIRKFQIVSLTPKVE